jgi:Domain of unknown function (DUF6378)/Domain of unknown function (DUF4406)
MIIYIAGPMRGYPRYNFDAFDAAQADLVKRGYEVISPAQMDRDVGFDPDCKEVSQTFLDEAMCRDIEAIKKADGVALLPGWERSTGAQAEMWLARWRHIPVFLYPAMIRLEDEDVLAEAFRLTSGDRQNAYGPPDQDFQRTATMWSTILGVPVKAKHVALCMIALKISRATWHDKRDNAVDIAGYARCLQICIEAEGKK